jgi:hypothetical protein
MRHVKLSPGNERDAHGLEMLIEDAYAGMKAIAGRG